MEALAEMHKMHDKGKRFPSQYRTRNRERKRLRLSHYRKLRGLNNKNLVSPQVIQGNTHEPQEENTPEPVEGGEPEDESEDEQDTLQ